MNQTVKIYNFCFSKIYFINFYFVINLTIYNGFDSISVICGDTKLINQGTLLPVAKHGSGVRKLLSGIRTIRSLRLILFRTDLTGTR